MAKNTTTLNKFLTGSVTAAMVATAIVPVAAANNDTAVATFSDVPVTDTHYDNVMKAVEYQFMKGYTNGTFGPYEEMPRSQVVKALAKYLIAESGMTEQEYVVANKIEAVTPFNDVSANHADNELFNHSLIVKEAGVFTGSNNNLMPTNKITRQQMAKVLVEAFGFKDLAGVESKVTDNDKADASLRSYINILSENGLTTETAFNPRGTVKRAQMASFLVRSHEAVNVEAPGVVSVTAVDTNKVEVEFKTAVKDTSDVSVLLKKGLATHYTVTSWSADKKTATLTAPSAIPAGDYDVVVSGISEKDSKTPIKIVAAKETSVAISNLSVEKSATAKVSYKVLNQYATDMKVASNSSDFVVQAYNVTKGTSVAATTGSTSDFTLNLSGAALNDDIRVTVSYKGITVQKTLKVVATAAAADIELGNAELPKDAVRFSVSTADVKLPYVLKDQYGAEVKLGANRTSGSDISTKDGVTFVSSNNAIVNPANITTDANGNLLVDLGATSGTVTLTAIINSTGDVSTTSITVEKIAEVKSVAISTPTKLVAAGESVELDFVVTDQYGGIIKNDSPLVSALDIAVSAGATASFVNGKLVVNTTTAGSKTVTINLDGTTTEAGKLTFNVEAAAVPTAITAVDVATLYENTAKDSVTFSDLKLKDQYGRDYTLKSSDTVKVSHKDGTADNVTFTEDGASPGVLVSGETLTFTGTSATANEVIAFELSNGASYDLALASVATSDITSYSIKPVASIYATTNTDYATTLELVGKTSSGKEVALVSNKITNATTSDASVATVTSSGVVTGVKAGTSTIGLWNGGTKLAETTVTVSAATPVATAVKFEGLGSTVSDNEDLSSKVVVTDQYGVNITATALANGFWTTSNASVATIDDGVVTKVTAGKVTLGFVTSNGLVVSKEVTVN